MVYGILLGSLSSLVQIYLSPYHIWQLYTIIYRIIWTAHVTGPFRPFSWKCCPTRTSTPLELMHGGFPNTKTTDVTGILLWWFPQMTFEINSWFWRSGSQSDIVWPTFSVVIPCTWHQSWKSHKHAVGLPKQHSLCIFFLCCGQLLYIGTHSGVNWCHKSSCCQTVPVQVSKTLMFTKNMLSQHQPCHEKISLVGTICISWQGLHSHLSARVSVFVFAEVCEPERIAGVSNW